MQLLKKLKLRTKLVGGFMLLALFAGIVSYTLTQFAFEELTEDALPTLNIMSQTGKLTEAVHEEILAFVLSGDEDSVEQFNQHAAELDTLSVRLSQSVGDNSEKAAVFQNVAKAIKQLTDSGPKVFQAHRQTSEQLQKLQEAEEDVNLIFNQAQAIVEAEIVRNLQDKDVAELQEDSIPTQRAFNEFISQARLLQLEALEFVASGSEEAIAEFEAAQVEMEAAQKKLEQLLEASEPGETELLKQVELAKAQIESQGRAVLEAHTKTRSLLAELEDLEKELDQAVAGASLLANDEATTEIEWVNWSIVIAAVVILIVSAILGWIITNNLVRPIYHLADAAKQIESGQIDPQIAVDTQDEIGDLAQAFNRMTARLQGLIGNLEERTRALEISAEISQQITAILERDELLKFVVNHLRDEFNFYHTHLYLIEEGSGDLVMAEGSGEVGRQLKERGHRLPLGQGIVGAVATTNRPFLSNNVNEVPYFVRNALLPETNSELAVPLRKGEQVLGVLDIQSEQFDRFTPEDMALMQSIADQTAVVLDNARLLAESRQALQEVERLNRRLTRESWQEFHEEITTSGYRFTRGVKTKIAPDSDAWLQPMQQAAAQKHLVAQVAPANSEKARAELAVPLMLRGEVIGVLGVKREETANWAEEEKAAVEAVANQVALALENARLSKEQEKTIVKLKDVDRLKSEFLTSMSHELRTPLNSIIGFADVLLQGIDGELNEMAMGDIRLIYNSGKHLLALINDILDLAKIEAGKMELVREKLDLKDIVDNVLASSSSLVKDKPVQIAVHMSDALPPVNADKLRLNQILLNLVSNAAKFTHQGAITIKAGLSQEPGFMRIGVVDTGIGISPEKINTIFERFRQADSSTTRKYGGTGLGLAICKQLIEMHGGTIGVKSEEGAGSEFYFTVPLAQVPVI